MSDTDSFIDEVNEEVRRDRLFALYRRYGWIAVLVILGIVGGVAWSEYSRAQDTAEAQALGDSLIAASQPADAAARAEALARVTASSAGGRAVAAFLEADALIAANDPDGAVAALEVVTNDTEVPAIYRQMASFKSLLAQQGSADLEARRAGFEELAAPGNALRLLAEEQLVLIDVQAGQTDAALDRLQGILQDSEVSGDLMQRAAQLIVALGGTPEFGASATLDAGNEG